MTMFTFVPATLTTHAYLGRWLHRGPASQASCIATLFLGHS